MSFKPLFLTTAAVLALAPVALAETVTTRTVIQPQPLPGLVPVDFTVFDINRDGFFSMPEVGERLFTSFDKDGNGHIDLNEWKHKAVMTITPMSKETFKYVDSDNDGHVEETTYTYQTFYVESGLSRFDENKNGLTPQEFLNIGFRKADRDDDNMISLEEWKEAYLQTRPRVLDPANYNN